MKAIRVRAYWTDEGFGYDRWMADEYSCGRGTHDAVLILLDQTEDLLALLDKLYAALGIRQPQTYEEKLL